MSGRSFASLTGVCSGYTWGFREIDLKWGVDSLVQSMKTIHSNTNGSDRTYWDFFVVGLFVTVLMVFAAIIAWEFGGLPAETLAARRISAWGSSFALSWLRT